MEGCDKLSAIRRGFFKFLRNPKIFAIGLILSLINIVQIVMGHYFLRNVFQSPLCLTLAQLIQGLILMWCMGAFGDEYPKFKYFQSFTIDFEFLCDCLVPAILNTSVVLLGNIILYKVRDFSLYPVAVCIPASFNLILSSVSSISENKFTALFGAILPILAFLIHIIDLWNALLEIFLYIIILFIYRTLYLRAIIYRANKDFTKLQAHFQIVGIITISILVVIFGNFSQIKSKFTENGSLYIIGCFVFLGCIPFTKSVVVNYLSKSGGFLWRFSEVVSIPCIFISGQLSSPIPSLNFLFSGIMLVISRLLIISDLLCGYNFERDDNIRSLNPFFLPQLYDESHDKLTKPLIKRLGSNAEQSNPLKPTLIKIVRTYVTRTYYEELEMLEKFGNEAGLENSLQINTSTGLPDDTESNELRKKEFGENKLPEKKLTPFLRLCFDAADNLTLKILMICGVVSIFLNLFFSKHPEIEWIEGFAIWIAVLVVILVTAGNDWLKEKQFQKLAAVKDDKLCSVKRNGGNQQMSVHDLVVGDILNIETGDELSADCLLISSSPIKVDESSLTGESDQISKSNIEECWKQVDSIRRGSKEIHGHHEVDSPILLSGTTISSGSGSCIVMCVGLNSQVGQMYQKLAFDAEPTPLQKKLNSIASDIGNLGFICACLTLFLLVVEYWISWASQSESSRDDIFSIIEEHVNFIITTITIVVVAVPEGLPLAVTISLAYSIGQMLTDKNYVRRLAACEIMGGANEICSDKTGTLTTNRMTVQSFWNDDIINGDVRTDLSVLEKMSKDYLDFLVENIALNSTGFIQEFSIDIPSSEGGFRKDIKYVGSPTECALLQLTKDLGSDYDFVRQNRLSGSHDIIRKEFDSKTKIMSTIVGKNGENYFLFVKGASEIVLKLCTKRLDGSNKIVELSSEEKLSIESKVIDRFAKETLRTLCLAYKELDEESVKNIKSGEYQNYEEGLICVGIAGISDPVRPEVPEAVLNCHRAGINVRMVTGDNILTAKEIAKKCNIYKEDEGGIAMIGSEFYKLVGGVVCKHCKTEVCKCASDEKTAKAMRVRVREDVLGDMEKFTEIADKLQILARSQPNDKYALVTGLKQKGEIVAVTGDGTNDAPALKKADVGFAMGIAGKEIAKHAADIVLLDDNFFSIIQAVKWGRNIYDNIRRFLQFQLTVNVVAVTISLLFALIGRQSPLDAVQMLWLNLIMDSFASLALATEKPTDELLKRKPHRRNEYLVSKSMTRSILVQAIYQLIVLNLIIFYADRFIPEKEWSYLSEETKRSSGFCEFSDCDYLTGKGTLIRSGRNYFPFSKVEDYKREWDNTIGPSRHFTFIFNTFVFMQMFNMINARKINGEINVFKGFFKNELWLIIWVLLIISQILMVEYGGFLVRCHLEGLTLEQWIISFIFGMGGLLVNLLNQFIPLEYLPELGIKESNPLDESESFVMQAKGRNADKIASRLQVVKSVITAKKFAHRVRIRTANRMSRRLSSD